MTPRTRPDVSVAARARVVTRRRRDLGRSRRSRGLGGAVGGHASAHSGLAGDAVALPVEEVWDRHGGSAYALACALLGDEEAAARVVPQAVHDFARSAVGVPADEAHRVLSRHVYWRSRELVATPLVAAPPTSRVPPAMVLLAQLAHLQRACVALCTFGGLTHREVAELLGVPPLAVARSLTSGLRELGCLTAGGATA